MSVDYYASFEPVELPRVVVFERLVDILKERSVRFDEDIYRLEIADGRFEYNGSEISEYSTWRGLEKARDWTGVELHMNLFERACSLLFLNRTIGRTAVAFVQSGGLIHDQIVNPQLATDIAMMLADMMNVLGAAFCIVEPGWTCSERTLANVEEWAADVTGGKTRDWKDVFLSEGVLPLTTLQRLAQHYERRGSFDSVTWLVRK